VSATAVTPWQRAWRDGIVPQLSTAGLEALQKALECDDPALIQGQSLLPPPLQSHESDPVIAACAIGLAAWKADCQEGAPVGEVDIRFAEICSNASQRLGEPGAVHFFLAQYDSWTREEMRRNLLSEVRLALAGRQHESGPPGWNTHQKEPTDTKPPKRMAPSTTQERQAHTGQAS
jgi:hypothetical protein